MVKGYHHLKLEDRCQIYALKKQGVKQKEIAKAVGKSESCVSKELRRNKNQQGYQYDLAHKKSVKRRTKASKTSGKKLTSEIKKLLAVYIKKQWSPVQISGRLKVEHNISISHELIYQYVWADKKAGGFLYTHLRHRGKKYNKRSGKNAGRGLIPNRKDIAERPSIVEQKVRIGDFEIDTIIGKNHKGAIVSLVDRASKYTKLIKVERKTAAEVSYAIKHIMRNIKHRVLTMTADNGKEFSYHLDFGAALGADIYFARPYRSCDRGLNEHTNGLVRQYFPKKTDFDNIDQVDVASVEQKLNSRPRKSLNFKTPEEVFFNLGFAA
jgi:transposase, IS30 family